MVQNANSYEFLLRIVDLRAGLVDPVMTKYNWKWKNKRRRGKITKTREKKKITSDRVLYSTISLKQMSSFKGARDFDRRLFPRVKRPSNDGNNTFAITPANWTQCL